MVACALPRYVSAKASIFCLTRSLLTDKALVEALFGPYCVEGTCSCGRYKIISSYSVPFPYLAIYISRYIKLLRILNPTYLILVCSHMAYNVSWMGVGRINVRSCWMTHTYGVCIRSVWRNTCRTAYPYPCRDDNSTI